VMKKSVTLVCLILLFSLFACVNTTDVLIDKSIVVNAKESFPTLSVSHFGKSVDIQSEAEMLKLSDQQKETFFSYYYHPERKNISGHVRLYEYLESMGEKFKYSELTSNAEKTLHSKSGNCMSLAVLTTALAHSVNVDIKYQLVNRIPVYKEYGSVVFNAQHIRSIVYEDESLSDGTVNLVRKKAVIDYYPSSYNYVNGAVSKRGFIGMYYRNLAAEALALEDYNLSFWLLKHSLEVDPDNAGAINSLAVLHRRVGAEDVAEELYLYGIKHAESKVTLLKNYYILLNLQNRHADAERILKELDNLDDFSPFNWLQAANDAFKEKNYTTALKLYNKTITLAPYLHQGYFGIARTQYQLGHLRAAREALETALDKVFDIKAKSLYEAKLAVLKQERMN